MRKIEVTSSLYELAKKLLPEGPLYITGGYVRNHIMSVGKDDMDLASYINPKEVIELLKGSEFRVVPVNVKLGTIKIIKDKESYEYTAFRRDNYPDDGSHRPMSVTFTKDIKSDAMRRDFTVNAIYYNILKNEYIDFFHGFKDIENKILRTTINPETVFSEDGLRILRLVRFVAELDFDVDKDTYQAAKENVVLLKDIAPERIQVELNKILRADQRYFLNDKAHLKGFEMLRDIGALDIIFPMLKINNIDIIADINPNVRLTALLINNSNSKDKISRSLNNLRYKKTDIRVTLRLKELLSEEIDNNKAIEVIIDNADIIDKYSSLLCAFGRIEEHNILEEKIKIIEDNHLPYSISCLEVNGKDLIELGVPEHTRSEVLRKLLMHSIDNRLRDRSQQLEYLKESII